MTLTIPQWHQRYLQQARWTQNLRTYLYQKCGIHPTTKILDIGCGTGVVENELANLTAVSPFGIDIDFTALKFAQNVAPKTIYTVGDCLSLPYLDATFDVTLCHFLLLWIDRVQDALAEMVRVTRPNGTVLALAEPDYGGRIDFPNELSQIGCWQTGALKQQGANPFIGRQLRSLFSSAGVIDIEVGVLGGQWGNETSATEIELEWLVIQSDLKNNDEFLQRSDAFKAIELSSQKAQQRVLFVPVFYAFGRKQN